MPRLLEELPKWGYTYYLNLPKMDGTPKLDILVPGTAKDGEEYMSKRHNPKRRLHPMTTYNVLCTSCFDAGCDKCPVSED